MTTMAHNALAGDLSHCLSARAGSCRVPPRVPAVSLRAQGLGHRSAFVVIFRSRPGNPRSAHMTNTQRGAPARRLPASRIAASRSLPSKEALCACTSCLDPPMRNRNQRWAEKLKKGDSIPGCASEV
jgi:hypothetical protein